MRTPDQHVVIYFPTCFSGFVRLEVRDGTGETNWSLNGTSNDSADSRHGDAPLTIVVGTVPPNAPFVQASTFSSLNSLNGISIHAVDVFNRGADVMFFPSQLRDGQILYDGKLVDEATFYRVSEC